MIPDQKTGTDALNPVYEISIMFNRISQIFSPPPSTLKNSHQETPHFRHGEIIKGTIIQKFPGGGILVSTGGRQFRANTVLDLTKGDEYRFLVKILGSRIELKLLDVPTQRSASPLLTWQSIPSLKGGLAGLLLELTKDRNLPGLNAETGNALKNLHNLLPALIFSDHGEKNFLWISRFILGSGLFWENKVLQYLLGEKNRSWKRLVSCDLKGSLLLLDRSLQAEDHGDKDVQSMAEKTKKALELVEQDQKANLSSLRDQMGWFIVIPGFEEDGFRYGALFFNKVMKGEGFRLSLFLEFTMLGRIQLDVTIIESVIGMEIHTEDQGKADFVNENLHILKTSLQELGMKTGRITCTVKEVVGSDELGPVSGEEEQPSPVHLVI